MISITTSDGTVHSANTWKDVLESAHPNNPAGKTLGLLINICSKEHGIDVTFGQPIEEANAFQILCRLHECKTINLDFTLLP